MMPGKGAESVDCCMGVTKPQLWQVLFDLAISVSNRSPVGIQCAMSHIADLAGREGKEAEATRLRQIAEKFAEPPTANLASEYLIPDGNPRALSALVLDPSTLAAVSKFLAARRGASILRQHNLEVPSRILLRGPSGCGKTSLARALATELHLPLYRLASHAVIGKMMGETASRLVQVFDQLSKAPPCVILFDEADALFWRRTEDGGSAAGEMRRTVSAVLPVLEALPDRLVIVAATNAPPKMIDVAVMRRFHLRLDMPSGVADAAVRALGRLASKTSGIEVGEIPEDVVATCLEKCDSLADVEEVFRSAQRSHVLENIPMTRALREAAEVFNRARLTQVEGHGGA